MDSPLHCHGQITIIYEIRPDVVANLPGLFYALDPGEVGLIDNHSTYIHWCLCLITEHVLFLKYPLPKEFRAVAKEFRTVAKGFRAVAKGFRAVAKGLRAVAKGFRAVANEIWIKGGSAKLRCMFCNKVIVPARYLRDHLQKIWTRRFVQWPGEVELRTSLSNLSGSADFVSWLSRFVQ